MYTIELTRGATGVLPWGGGLNSDASRKVELVGDRVLGPDGKKILIV